METASSSGSDLPSGPGGVLLCARMPELGSILMRLFILCYDLVNGFALAVRCISLHFVIFLYTHFLLF